MSWGELTSITGNYLAFDRPDYNNENSWGKIRENEWFSPAEVFAYDRVWPVALASIRGQLGIVDYVLP